MNPEHFDLVVVGSGEGGKFLAWTLARKGKKVAVVERKWIGGSCPNIACLPSKNIIHSAKVASYFGRGKEFGVLADNVRIDMGSVRERKRKMVSALVDVHVDNYKQSGAELIMGHGRFTGPMTLEVALLEGGGTRILQGEHVVLNVGGRSRIDPVPGLREAEPMTHIEALELGEVPGHLLILGGGYIGLEFAQAMRRFGSAVTIVERNEHLVHREDRDISEALTELCKDEGISLVTGAQISRVEGRSGDQVRLRGMAHGAEIVLQGTHLLIASGRTPNTDGMGLEAAGVAITHAGFIEVDERLQTSAPGVWAIGDCTGAPHFTHVSFDDFRIVRDNILGGERVTTGRHIPICMFTDPEFARIGLSEKQAKEDGIAYRLAKIPMKADLRTRTLSETRGFMKALIAADSDRILGFTMFGVMAGEVMSTVQTAMMGEMPFTAMRDAVYAHPTMIEGLISLFSAVPPRITKT